jgi:hypothetical protein
MTRKKSTTSFMFEGAATNKVGVVKWIRKEFRVGSFLIVFKVNRRNS